MRPDTHWHGIWLLAALAVACGESGSPDNDKVAARCVVSNDAAEACDDVDNNCDGVVDEGCDDDGDGFCDASMAVTPGAAACPQGGNDCHDDDQAVHPAAAESACDGRDDDCDGKPDQGCDDDGDGYCDASMVAAPEAAVCPRGGGDCNDDDADVHPKAEEGFCDDRDDDCDGTTDEGCDGDGDGYCSETMVVIGTPAICTSGGNDCDDGSDDIYPGATELCGTTDMNCDGSLPTPSMSGQTLRAAVPRSTSEELAYNGTDRFAAVWVEEQTDNAVARYAILNPGATVASGPFDLTDGQIAATHTSIAYEAQAQVFGIAYLILDPLQQTPTLRFATVNNAGSIMTDVEVGPASERTVRVESAPGHFGIFFERDTSRPEVIHHAGYDTATSTLGAPSALEGIPAGKHLNTASLVHNPNACCNGAGSFFLAWSDYDAAYTPGQGIGIIAVRANTSGAPASAFKHLVYPDAEQGYRPSLFFVNGKTYAAYRGDRNTASSYSRDYFLRAVEVDAQAALVGGARTLLDNARGCCSPRLFATEGPNNAGNVGLLYFGYDATLDESRTFLARWDASWNPLSPPAPTWFGDIDSRLYGARGAFHDKEYYALDSLPTGRLFTVAGFDHTDPDDLVDGFDREPVTVAPFSTSLNQSVLAQRYDAASDALVVLQSKVGDSSKLETYRVGADGAIAQAPAFHSDAPADCGSWFVESDAFVCYGFKPLFDFADCYSAPGPDNGSPHYGFMRHHYDAQSSAWIAQELGQLSGLWYEDPSEPWFTMCQQPILGAPPVDSSAGKVAFINVFHLPQTAGWPNSKLRKYRFATGAITSFEELFASDDTQSHGSFRGGAGTDHAAFAFVESKSASQTHSLKLFVVDLATGMLQGPPSTVREMAITDGNLRADDLAYDGERFGVLSVQRLGPCCSNFTQSAYIDLVAPAAQAVVATIAIDALPQYDHLFLRGYPNYHIIFNATEYGQFAEVYDDAGSKLNAASWPYTTRGISPAMPPQDVGGAFRWLLRADQHRIIHTALSCSAP